MDGLFNASTRPSAASGVLFAEDFDAPPAASPAEPEVIAPVFSAAELDAVREAAWADGRAAGLSEAAAGAAGAMREAAVALAAEFAALRDVVRGEAERNAEHVAGLLLGALAACFPALCARHGQAEAVAVLRAVLPGIAQEPSATIRANPAVIPALTREIEHLDPDFAERVRLTPDGRMAAGDVRIAWSGGSASREAATIWREVAAALQASGVAIGVAIPVEETVA